MVVVCDVRLCAFVCLIKEVLYKYFGDEMIIMLSQRRTKWMGGSEVLQRCEGNPPRKNRPPNTQNVRRLFRNRKAQRDDVCDDGWPQHTRAAEGERLDVLGQRRVKIGDPRDT